MKGIPEVVEVLNEVLCAELTGINQDFIHAMMCRNWGYSKLSRGDFRDAERLFGEALVHSPSLFCIDAWKGYPCYFPQLRDGLQG